MHGARRLGAIGVALGLVVALAADSARALPPVGLPGRPIRLEGRWMADLRAPDVLEVITISDGRAPRRFGVTALQAYFPGEEGAQVLRHSIQRPVTLLLRGERAMVDRFIGATDGQHVVAYGVYGAGGGMLTLSGVDLVASDGRHVD